MRRIAAAILVGVLGAAIQAVTVDAQQTTPSTSFKAKPCLKFRLLNSALTFTKQSESIELQSYSVSDGTTVYANYSYYRSSNKAVNEMNKALTSAIEIISREPLLDEKGQKIGMKVIGRFKSRMPGRQFQVLWTDRSKFKIISGPSLDHISQLLKRDCK